jgi:hypothetical protein
LLYLGEYKDQKQRRKRNGLLVDDTKRPS